MDTTSEDAQRRRGVLDTLLEIGTHRKQLLLGIRDAIDSNETCKCPCQVGRLAAKLVGRSLAKRETESEFA